jgi:NADPH:quinone reductase-like Zn-dependent oxidoreductase
VIVDPTLYTGDDEGLLEASFMGSERDGGFAEYTTVPAANAHLINSPLSDAELATFPTAYVTGEHMLNRARLKPGETILITGASGGVGSGLVQLAHIRGARVVAIVGSGKEEKMHQLGAEIVVTRDIDKLYNAVTEAIGGQSIDVVADVVGGSMFSVLLRLLRKQGRYVTAGAIAGPTVPLDLRTVYLKHLEIIGSTLGTRQEFADLVSYIEARKLKPLLARTYPLENIKQAQSDFKEKQFFGKLVIVLY